MRERTEEQRLKRWCRRRKIPCLKVTVVGEMGWPDRLVLIPGVVGGVWIEMKKPKGGVISGHQQRRIDWLNANGYAAAVCLTGEEAIAFCKLFWSDR